LIDLRSRKVDPQISLEASEIRVVGADCVGRKVSRREQPAYVPAAGLVDLHWFFVPAFTNQAVYYSAGNGPSCTGGTSRALGRRMRAGCAAPLSSGAVKTFRLNPIASDQATAVVKAVDELLRDGKRVVVTIAEVQERLSAPDLDSERKGIVQVDREGPA